MKLVFVLSALVSGKEGSVNTLTSASGMIAFDPKYEDGSGGHTSIDDGTTGEPTDLEFGMRRFWFGLMLRRGCITITGKLDGIRVEISGDRAVHRIWKRHTMDTADDFGRRLRDASERDLGGDGRTGGA
jgi:hypothetical protein